MKIEKNYEDSLVLAVDIGGSKYIIGFVDFEGNVLYQERIEWISMDEKSIIHQMMDSLEMLCRKMPDLFKRVAVGGVTIPGFADPVTGVWTQGFLFMRIMTAMHVRLQKSTLEVRRIKMIFCI